ncbi:MAG: glycosyltransferase family 4 protein [Thermodesulfobacteriota bacterium]
MNLLLFNLATDSEHVTLAFALKWVKELAHYFDHIDIVTMYEGKHDLPENVSVWSVGRERGYSKLSRIWKFYTIVLSILRLRRVDIAFTHMIHIFAVLFWPIAKVYRIRNVLWYAHGAVPFGLRIAHFLVDKIISPTPESFRLPSDKVEFLGHGIDTNLFTPSGLSENSTFRIISVGRISPVKGLDILVEALRGWIIPDGKSWELTIIGTATTDIERAYEKAFVKRVLELNKCGRISLLGRLDQIEIAQSLKQADVFISLSATGSLDKAIIEAMACGCPVLSSNDAFYSIAERNGFPECYVSPSPDSVRSGLDWMVNLSEKERKELSMRVEEVAKFNHSLDSLIQKLKSILFYLARS